MFLCNIIEMMCLASRGRLFSGLSKTFDQGIACPKSYSAIELGFKTLLRFTRGKLSKEGILEQIQSVDN